LDVAGALGLAASGADFEAVGLAGFGQGMAWWIGGGSWRSFKAAAAPCIGHGSLEEGVVGEYKLQDDFARKLAGMLGGRVVGGKKGRYAGADAEALGAIYAKELSRVERSELEATTKRVASSQASKGARL
jgi:hypothetical protein